MRSILALSSTIPPSPDQAQGFADKLAQAHGQNVAVLAAAGNQPGAVEEPAAEPGVFRSRRIDRPIGRAESRAPSGHRATSRQRRV